MSPPSCFRLQFALPSMGLRLSSTPPKADDEHNIHCSTPISRIEAEDGSKYWPDLPRDLQELIILKSFPNIIQRYRIASALPQWRSPAMDSNISCNPPWLLKLRYRELLLMYWPNHSELSQFHIDLPRELTTLQCIGSSRGWLILLSSLRETITLMNPVSEARIDLPPNRRLIEDLSWFSPVALSSSPQSRGCLIVISRFMCKIGGKRWTRLTNDQWLFPTSYVFHRGRLYSLNAAAPFRAGELVVKMKVISGTGSILVGDVAEREIRTPQDVQFGRAHMVASGEQLLMVVVNWNWKCRVFELIREKGGCSLRWIEIHGLGDRALCLGYCRSICLSGIGLRKSSMRSNCIYFCGPCQVLMYCLDDGRVHDTGLPCIRYEYLDWFMPSEK